jgi:ATP-dependent RNA helicase DeaD
MSDLPEAAEAAPFAGLPSAIQESLVRRGFAGLTPIQRAVVDARLDGRNLRISSQTGSGKTVALGLALLSSLTGAEESSDAEQVETAPSATEEPAAPAASAGKRPHAAPVALIITPTRELALQVRSELAWFFENYPQISSDVVTGGTDVRGEQRRLVRYKPTVVVGTPGRLLDHLTSGVLALGSVREVVLDEADQMLDMGFKDDLDAIVARLPAQRRSHLVSATFPLAVRRLAEKFQSDPLHLEGTRLGAANADISHQVHLIPERERFAALLNVLLNNLGKRCLVFVQRRADATEAAESLSERGLAALPLSGDLPQAQRNRTLSAFKTGTVNILIATDVAARGLHVDDIATVVHAELPRDPNVYTHRSGRTGRAGQQGESILLVTPTERRRAERILAAANVTPKWAPPPTGKKIQQRLNKQLRSALHARMEQPDPEAGLLEYAGKLLENYPPSKLVAALLSLAEQPLPCEPMQLSELKFERTEPRERAREPRMDTRHGARPERRRADAPEYERRRPPPRGKPYPKPHARAGERGAQGGGLKRPAKKRASAGKARPEPDRPASF